ncbi:MAG: hypothetical protein JWO67_6404 [Streptosporangiaceae bacterium]|nr:hypothetical protein [Streptosporangiaceae bacterium]
MGVLCDYFRAPDRATALALHRHPDGLLEAATSAKTEAMDFKGLDPVIILGKLVGLLSGVSYDAFGRGHADEVRPIMDELVGLARRARDADQMIYCAVLSPLGASLTPRDMRGIPWGTHPAEAIAGQVTRHMPTGSPVDS